MRESIQKNHLFLLLLFVVGFQLVGWAISNLTMPEIGTWYETLKRSPLTPPNQWFGIVWSILYLLLSLSAWAVVTSKDMAFKKMIVSLFAIHMLVNWAWNPVFFNLHALFPAFVMILFLIFTAAMLLYLIWPARRWAALAFLPYLVWLTFAGHLSQFIWLNN